MFLIIHLCTARLQRERISCVRCVIVALTVVRRGLTGDICCEMIKEREPELHHSVLVRSGNSRYFSPWRAAQSTTTTTTTTTRSSRPSQLREHVVAADMWSGAFRRAVALQGTAGLECWVSSSAQGPPSAGHGELLTDECVWVCEYVFECVPCQKTPSIPPPKCNTAHLHSPRAPCRMSIPKLLSFSMNAQVCNLAPTNWIRISGGFIPSGSTWSPVFHWNNCQSRGGTEVHIWTRGFVPAFNSACLPARCKPLWSRLPASSSKAPRVRPPASVLSVSLLLYVYDCLPRRAVVPRWHWPKHTHKHNLKSNNIYVWCKNEDAVEPMCFFLNYSKRIY